MQSSYAAILTKWKTAKDWRDLLRLNARFIRDDDPTTPYSPSQAKAPENMHKDMLRLQEYGFLVRYAQGEGDSGAVYNHATAQWTRTSERAVVHVVLPTASAVPVSKVEALVQKLVDDRVHLEVVVLADYVEYPRARDLGVGFHGQYAAPRSADAASSLSSSSLSSSRELELFRSTVGVGARPSGRLGTKTGTTYGRYKEAGSKEELEKSEWKKRADRQLPYMTVDDVADGSANARAFGVKLEAAMNAKCVEIVLASKRWDSGLALLDYLETLCIGVDMYPVFKEKEEP